MDELIHTLLHPLLWPLLAPLAAGALAYGVCRVAPLAAKLLALAAAAAVLAGGVVIAVYTGTAERFAWTWAELTPDLRLAVELAPTTLGLLVMIASACFALLICVYSFSAMAGQRGEGRFYALLTWALAGSAVVALAGNLLVLLVGWELVTLMLYLMINLGKGEARAGAAKAYSILGLADAGLLLAMALLAAAPGGSANWSLTRGAVAVGSLGSAGAAIYVLILAAALAKAGAIPLHSWIPAAAEDAPTPVMAYLPAALDKLLGIYLLAVLTLRMFQPDAALGLAMMLIGAVTILAAVLMAMTQHNLKRLLSFHAVSQVGYMVLGIGTGTTIGVIGGLFHMLNNAIYKSNLFLMSDRVGRAAGSDEIAAMGGLARRLPVTFVCGAVAAAAISGVPPFNGFVSKWLVYTGTLQVAPRGLAVALVVVAVFGSALTLASFVKVLYAAFLSPPPAGAGRQPARESLLTAAPMVVLAAACVVLGLAPQWAVEDVLWPAVRETGAVTAGEGLWVTLTGQVETGTLGLWNPTVATGLILLALVGGLAFLWLVRRGRAVRVVRPFQAGELPGPGDGRFRVPGTHLYETIGRLPLIGPLLAHGQRGAMDPYHWAARHGGGLVGVLRNQHTGLISLYVAWCLIGLAVTLVYLMLAAPR